MERLKQVQCISTLIRILLMILHFNLIVGTSKVTVDSPFGKIQGVENTDDTTGQSYVSFRGIPYAIPPLGDLRFRKPERHPKIDGVFDASKGDIIKCPEVGLTTVGENGFTEDCLVLNIHLPDVRPRGNSLRKVMVFIHGGGFFWGNSYIYDGKSFVISQDVILVTINYRLGAFGFMSTENEASPGNYGLWDQNLALKWVKDNIRAFGGDPNDVTISGESAGGAAVAFHMISPYTKELFTKAYAQSGTATSVFGLAINAQSHALTIAKSTGCWEKDVHYNLSVQESQAVVNCMRQVPASALTANVHYSATKTQFVPVVDGDFIPDLPLNLLQDDTYLDSIGFFDRSYLIAMDNNELGFVDTLLKMTKDDIFSNNERSKDENQSLWNKFLNEVKDMNLLSRLGEFGTRDTTVVDKIDDFYTRRFDNESYVIQLMSDLNFLVPNLDYLMTASRRPSCDVFFLHFDHFPHYMKGDLKGTPHALDLVYWLDLDVMEVLNFLPIPINVEMSEEDVEIKTLLSSIIGKFTRSGNPGNSLENVLPFGWPKYDVTNSYYLNLNSNPWISSFMEKDKQDFWFKTIPELLKKQTQQHIHSEL